MTTPVNPPPMNPPPSPFIRGTTNTSSIYYLSNGTRRLIPDAQTLSFMQAGQTVRILSDADLAAISARNPLALSQRWLGDH